MALTADQQRDAWRKFSDLIQEDGPLTMDKTDLRAAADSIDSWLASNQASFNSGLPQPFKAETTASQKSKALRAILEVVYG